MAELPEYRILPNFKQVVSSSNMWQSAQDGGPFLFIQALLRTSAVPTYLRDDWYRDWGSIERYDRVVPAVRGAERRRRAGLDAGVRLEPQRTDQGAAMRRRHDGQSEVARWVATIAGLIGFVLSVATPLLPVVQTTATLNWPQDGQLNNVTAPLISLTPVSMTVTVPCDVIRSMPPAGGMVLGTAPKSGKQAALNALFVNVTTQRVDITDRNVVVASVPRAKVAAPRCQRIEITSSEAGTFATFVGLTKPDGQGAVHRLRRPQPAARDRRRVHRPHRARAARPVLSAVIDTRFSTSPTPLKLAAMLLAIVSPWSRCSRCGGWIGSTADGCTG